MGTRHREFTVGLGIHKIQSFEYADAAARAGAAGLTADDVGKVAVQLNNTSFWILQSHDPIIWRQLGEIAASSVPANRTAMVDSAFGTPTGAIGDLNTAFDTVAGALDAVKLAGPTEGACYAIEIRPGTYVEPTLELEPWIIVRASSGGCSVTIEPEVATTAIVTGAPNARLEGVRLSGANGVGGIGISHATAGDRMTVTDCIIDDCEIAAQSSGIDSQLLITRSTIRRSGVEETMLRGGDAISGGRIDLVSTDVLGASGALIERGVATDADSTAITNETDLSFCDSAVYANGGAITVRSARIADSNVGLHVPIGGPGPGSGGSIDARNCDIVDCVENWSIEDPGASLSVNGVLLSGPIEVTGSASLFGSWLDGRPTEQSVHIQGGLRIGSTARPTDIFVNGGPHTDNVEAFTNPSGEAGPFTLVTTDLFDPETSVALFEGTTVDQAFYIGNDFESSALEVVIAAAMSLGTGSVDVQYWNGDILPDGDWSTVTRMTADAETLESYGSALFNEVATQYIRLGNMPGWDRRELGSPSFAPRKFWLRLIVTSPIDTVPFLTNAALLSDATRFSTRGTQYFGSTRPERVTPLANWNVGSGPANENLLIATDITEVQQLNKFGRVGTRTAAQKLALPVWTDTSLPAQVKIEWHADGIDTGLGIWYVRARLYAPTAILDGTAVSVEQSASANGPGTAGQGLVSTVEFDISAAISTDCWNLGLAWERRPVSPDLLTDDMVVRRIDLVTRDYR